jgi:hypothetical protein
VRREAQQSYAEWCRLRDIATRAAVRARDQGEGPGGRVGNFTVVQVKRSAILHRMFATEKRAILTPNFYHVGINTGPCIDARADSDQTGFQKAAHAYILDDLKYLAAVNGHGVLGAAKPRFSMLRDFLQRVRSNRKKRTTSQTTD